MCRLSGCMCGFDGCMCGFSRCMCGQWVCGFSEYHDEDGPQPGHPIVDSVSQVNILNHGFDLFVQCVGLVGTCAGWVGVCVGWVNIVIRMTPNQATSYLTQCCKRIS